jgi:hypothetical protein
MDSTTAEHYCRRLAMIITHPAFCGLTVIDEDTYRLEMITPVGGAWVATGSLKEVIDQSEELPLDG